MYLTIRTYYIKFFAVIIFSLKYCTGETFDRQYFRVEGRVTDMLVRSLMTKKGPNTAFCGQKDSFGLNVQQLSLSQFQT